MIGVHIGQATKVDGDKVRSGVSVILPCAPADVQIPCYADMHTLNGDGEVTGSCQIKDWGYINTVRLNYAGLNYVISTSVSYYRWIVLNLHHLSCSIFLSVFCMEHIIVFHLLYTRIRISGCTKMHIITIRTAYCTHQLHFSRDSLSRHLEPHARAS